MYIHSSNIIGMLYLTDFRKSWAYYIMNYYFFLAAMIVENSKYSILEHS